MDPGYRNIKKTEKYIAINIDFLQNTKYVAHMLKMKPTHSYHI